MLSNIAQMLKVIAEIGPGTNGGFQAGDGLVAGQGFVDGIQGLGDSLEPGKFVFLGLAIQHVGLTRLAGGPQVSPRMGHAKGDVQFFATFDFNALKIDGFLPRIRIGRGHVDEIAVVGNHPHRSPTPTPEVVPAEFLELRQPGLALDGIKRLDRPLPLVLGEHLHAVHPQPRRLIKRVDHPPGNGKV